MVADEGATNVNTPDEVDFTPVDIDTLPHQRWAEETEEKLKLTRAMMPSGDAFDRYNTESFREGLLELRNAIAEAERFGVDALAYNQHGALADTAAYKQHGATLKRAKQRLRELEIRQSAQISIEVSTPFNERLAQIRAEAQAREHERLAQISAEAHARNNY